MNTCLFLVDFDLMGFLQGESFINALKSLGLAIVVWIVGSFIVGKVVGLLGKAMDRSSMDASLRPFLKSMIGALLKVLLLLAVASTLGMQVTSFVAILSAAAFAVGMALQGGLANFAGGVMILTFRPFKVGDMISAQGYTGGVTEIQIFNTILVTPDNETIIIPNGPLSNGSVTNYTTLGKRGLVMTFGIGYGDDIDKAKEVIQQVKTACPHLIDKEGSAPAVAGLGDSSVNLGIRLWVDPAKYFDAMFYMNEHIKKEFDKNNIGIPYPTMDVNVTQS
ncbi:MAG: mechanosensitive ion channel family protein [Aureispira sp.]